MSEREGRRITQREVAERSRVSLSSLQKWETDAQIPEGENLVRIARFYSVAPSVILHGEGAEPEQEALDLFTNFDQVARFLRNIRGPDPEQARLRRLDALEGYRRFLTAYGPLPDWWFTLKRQVERDELSDEA